MHPEPEILPSHLTADEAQPALTVQSIAPSSLAVHQSLRDAARSAGQPVHRRLRSKTDVQAAAS